MSPPSRQPTVFVAEDNAVLLQGLSRALQASGYAVRTATNGVRLIEVLETAADTPELLLVDLMMPEMNGLDVVRAVRRDPRWRRIPVLLLTAATPAELAGTDVPTCGVAVMFKPFRLRELLDRVGTMARAPLPMDRAAG